MVITILGIDLTLPQEQRYIDAIRTPFFTRNYLSCSIYAEFLVTSVLVVPLTFKFDAARNEKRNR